MININEYLVHKSKLSNPSPNRFITEAKEFLLKFSIENNLNTTELKVIFYMYVHDLNKIPRCAYKDCTNNVRFITYYHGFSKGCCHKHAKKISNLEKFGVETPFESNLIQDKVKSTFLERYGDSRPMATKHFKETMLRLYGSEIAMKSPMLKSKMVNNITAKFGGMGNASKEICKKVVKTNKIIFLKKLDSDAYPAIRLFSDEEYDGVKGWLKKYKWRCKKCTTVFTETITDGMVARCPKCFPKMTSGISHAETDLYESLNNPDIERSNKTILSGKELDMYIPNKKLAIEYNGLYWHSESKVGKNYHLWKTDECLRSNIKLIHIFESEWNNKRNQVLSLINCKLGKYKIQYNITDINIQPISYKQYNTFITNNSIFQPKQVDYIYGLFIAGSLISILSVIHNNHEYCINDFVTLLNTDNKSYLPILLNHFISIHNPDIIKVTVDRRYFTGNIFLNNGFQLLNITSPQCWEFGKPPSWETPNDAYDASMYRIWDCGNYVFEWKK